jgi:hypothetical protein
MTNAEYQALCKAAEDEFHRAIERAKAAKEEALRSLRTVKELWGRADWEPGATIINGIRRLLPSISGDFTLETVVALLETTTHASVPNLKRTSVSTALRRLRKDRLIELVRPGSGKRPATYRYCSSSCDRRSALQQPREPITCLVDKGEFDREGGHMATCESCASNRRS